MQLDDRPNVRTKFLPFRERLSGWLDSISTLPRHYPWKSRLGTLRRPRDPAGDGRSAILGQVAADLADLNRRTERDFLSIGGKLAEFIEAVDRISSELTALADMMSADQSSRASQALTCILERFTKIRARAEDGSGLLDDMRQEAGQLKHTLSAFQGMVTTLTTLGVLTQIETARLGAAGADFGVLSEGVKTLSGSVQDRVENALETARQLMPPIEGALMSAAARQKSQANGLPSMISVLLASISSFGEVQKRAHASSVRMQSRYSAISSAFKNLIVSIQFHDITRQQVEHVIEALRSVSSGSEGSAAAVALQSSHLADAGEKFEASAAAIARSLDDIAAHVLEMAEESRTLSGFSESAQDSFFLQMEQSCSAILARLARCAKAEASNEATHIGLAETVGRMREAVEKIQAIEIQMLRLALNASVQAAHIGPPGEALAVLAGTIQQLAFESGDRSKSLMQALGSISQASARLSVRCTSAKSSHCQASMVAAVEGLHSSNERSFARIGHIVVWGTSLRENLSAARKSFSVGPVFAQAVKRAREMLEPIARQNRRPFAPNGAGASEQGLDGFAQHYTMQAERDVHEGVTKGLVRAAPEAVQVQQTESPPNPAGEPGGDVEFF